MYRVYRHTRSRVPPELLTPYPSKAEVLSKKSNGLLYLVPKRYDSVTAAARSASSILKYVVGSVVAIVTGAGGGTYYAGRNPKFRHKVEENIPYTKELFEAVHGPEIVDQTSDKEDQLRPGLLKDESASLESKISDEASMLRQIGKGTKEKSTPDYKAESVAVITTMDHQPGVSSVDLDIAKAVSAKQEDSIQPDKSVPETPEKEPSSPENSVFITTMDHQPGISSVDLDISKDQKKKRKKGKLKDDEAEEKSTAHAEQVETTSAVEAPLDVKVEPIPPPVELTKEQLETLSELVDQSALEVLLEACVEEFNEAKEHTIQLQKNAVSSIQSYISKIGYALAAKEDDEEFDNIWKSTSDLEHESQKSVDEAKSSELILQEQIEKIQEIITAVKKSGSSQIADAARDAVSKASLELHEASTRIKKATQEFMLMDEYHGMLSKGKGRLEEELKRLAPALFDVDAKAQTESSESKSGALLAFALKKSEFLEKEIEKLKLEEKERVKILIEKLQKEEEQEYESRLKNEIERFAKEAAVEQEKRDAELLSHYESEIKAQLKRQAAAHRDHLADVLNVQAHELNEKHDEELTEKLTEEKIRHLDEVEKKVAKIHGIESMLTTVVDVEERNRKARKLWLAVQSLNSALATTTEDGRTKSLMPEMMAILKAADENEVVSLALSIIPEAAAVQGISTAEELKYRFETVKIACQRVGMIGDEGGSLWTYLLSYMRSFLVFNTAAQTDIESDVDVDNINTYDVLAKSERCINDGDLEQAAKFMSLLRGLPRKLARDWLRETRSYLETKQIAEFLLAYAASEGVGFS